MNAIYKQFGLKLKFSWFQLGKYKTLTPHFLDLKARGISQVHWCGWNVFIKL